MQRCVHPTCSHVGPEEDFTTVTNKPTKLCKYCRERARDSMRRTHARKRAGVKVARGRRPLEGTQPVTLILQVPADLYNKALVTHLELVRNFFQEQDGEIPEAFREKGELLLPPNQATPKAPPPTNLQDPAELAQAIEDWKLAFPERAQKYEAKPQTIEHRTKHWVKEGRRIDGKTWVRPEEPDKP